jgi:hypothetical protein
MTQRADESVGSCADVRARPGFGGAPEQRKGVFRNDRPRRAFNQDRRVLNGSQFGAVGKLESAGEDTVRHDGSKAERGRAPRVPRRVAPRGSSTAPASLSISAHRISGMSLCPSRCRSSSRITRSGAVGLDMARAALCNAQMPDDPTRIERRPVTSASPASAYGGVSFGQVALLGRVLCVECRSYNKRTALTNQECPQIRTGNGRCVLHATFKCSRAARTSRACIKRRWTRRRSSWQATRCGGRSGGDVFRASLIASAMILCSHLVAAAPKSGNCTSIQARCALVVGGRCDPASGRWQFGGYDVGRTEQWYNTCMSRGLTQPIHHPEKIDRRKHPLPPCDRASGVCYPK